jgi:hypothetical protein
MTFNSPIIHALRVPVDLHDLSSGSITALEPAKQHQHEDDNQHEANDTNTTVPESIAVSGWRQSTDAAEQEQDKDN